MLGPFSIRSAHGQHDPKYGALRLRRTNRDLPVMPLDNHAADRQSQSHSLRFHGNEGVKYAFGFFRIDAGSGIFHGHDNCVVVLPRGLYLQRPVAVADGIHRLDGIVNQN